jgi:mediator of RNA polymerase II transcription subunit 16
MPELSNLLALPSIMDNTGKSTAPPLILGLRSRAPGGENFQMAQTVIDRWECVEQRQNLQIAFEQIGSRRNSVSTELPVSNRLKRLDPVVINKVAVGCHPFHFGKVLVLTMADGSVEYRDRFTFEELWAAEDTDKVMNLKQVGWTFSEDGPCKSHLVRSDD